MFLEAGRVAAQSAGHQREHHPQGPPVLQPFHRARSQLVQGQSLPLNSNPSLLTSPLPQLNPSCVSRRSPWHWCIVRKTLDPILLPLTKHVITAVCLVYVVYFAYEIIVFWCIKDMRWWKHWEHLCCEHTPLPIHPYQLSLAFSLYCWTQANIQLIFWSDNSPAIDILPSVNWKMASWTNIVLISSFRNPVSFSVFYLSTGLACLGRDEFWGSTAL